MRITRKILAVIMIIALCLTAVIPAFAEQTEEENRDINEEITEEETPEEGNIFTEDGQEIRWKIEEGKLSISGEGKIPDFTTNEPAPWQSFSEYIQILIINEGITSVGAYAFADLTFLSEVNIPSSVIEINDTAFENCELINSDEIFHVSDTDEFSEAIEEENSEDQSDIEDDEINIIYSDEGAEKHYVIDDEGNVIGDLSDILSQTENEIIFEENTGDISVIEDDTETEEPIYEDNLDSDVPDDEENEISDIEDDETEEPETVDDLAEVEFTEEDDISDEFDIIAETEPVTDDEDLVSAAKEAISKLPTREEMFVLDDYDKQLYFEDVMAAAELYYSLSEEDASEIDAEWFEDLISLYITPFAETSVSKVHFYALSTAVNGTKVWGNLGQLPQHGMVIGSNDYPAYCLEHLRGAENGAVYTRTTWASLGNDTQSTIIAIVSLGYNTPNTQTSNASVGTARTAVTQLLVWAAENGYIKRGKTSWTWSSTVDSEFSTVAVNAYNPSEMKSYYNELKKLLTSSVSENDGRPSFTFSTETDAKKTANVVKLKYDPTSKKYTATLTDSKSVIANWVNDFGNVSGITLSVSGSKLTITASEFTGTKTLSAVKNNIVDEDSVTVWTVNNALYQNFALNGAPLKLSAYLAIECDSDRAGITVKKTSDDGNVSGVTFKLNFGSTDYVKSITGVENGVTKTTNSSGTISFGTNFPVYNESGNRIVYRITELENESLYTGLCVDTSSENGFIEKGTASDGTNPYVRFYLSNASGTVANYTAGFSNSSHKANVKVKKTSEDDVISGISFTLSASTDTAYVKTVTGAASWTAKTDANGVATFTVKLPIKNTSGSYITYKLSESTPVRYNTVADKTFTFSGTAVGGTKTVSFENTLKKSKITVTKTSDDGNVSGVTFRLNFSSTDFVKSISGVSDGVTMTTDASGKINFGSNFPMYNASGNRIVYRITELEDSSLYTGLSADLSTEKGFIEKGTAANGTNPYVRFYLGDETGVRADFSANFENHSNKAKVNVKKTSEDEVISGITFTLKPDTDSEYVKKVTGAASWTAKTDANGVAAFNVSLPKRNTSGTLITYRISETTPVKYNAVSDKTFTFSGIANDGTKTVSFSNTLKKSKISVTKTSDDGNVSGVIFKLTFTDKEYVTKISGYEYASTKTTDSTGKITFGSNFPMYNASGNRISYRITELENESLYTGLSADTSSETGFIETGTASNGTNPYVRFYLGDEKGVKADFAANFENHTNTALVKVKKTSEDNFISGIIFTLTAASDTDYVKKLTGGTSWEAKTDDKGVASFTVKLPMRNASGTLIKYKLEEKTTNERYNTPEAVSFDFNGIAKNSTKTVSFSNTLAKGNIEIEKKQAWEWTSEKTFLITGKDLNSKALGIPVTYYEKKTHKKISATGILVTTGKKYKYDYSTGKVTETGKYAAGEHKIYVSDLSYSTDITVTEVDITAGENDEFKPLSIGGLSLKANLKDERVIYDSKGVPTLKLTDKHALTNKTNPYQPVVTTGVDISAKWLSALGAVGVLIVLIRLAAKRAKN